MRRRNDQAPARSTKAGRDQALVLVLDIGGSSTRGILARTDGTVLGRARGGPGNHILCGWDAARNAIAEVIAQACTAAAVDAKAVSSVVAGSAGVGPNGEGREPVEALLRELVPAACVRTVGDMVTAFYGALSTDFGVVVAAGTGSVCYGRHPSGRSAQVGGWGQIIGDEGSAYDIAVGALRAGARATDGRGPRTMLTERLVAALEASGFVEVALRVYADHMARDAIAGLATVVAEAAAAGDAVARGLLSNAGRELGLAAVTALRTLELAASAAPVAYTGAVFEAGESIVGPFCRTVRSACPQAVIGPAEFPPIAGALKLALREVGVAFTSSTAAALRATSAGEYP